MLVERVIGRLTWGRVLLSGAASGAWFGLFVGLLLSLFSTGDNAFGPILVGLEKSVQIVPLGASVTEIITAATFAAYEEGAKVSEG